MSFEELFSLTLLLPVFLLPLVLAIGLIVLEAIKAKNGGGW